MKSAQQQLLPGDVVSPERRLVLGNGDYGATAEVTTPGIRVKTVPPSITPPYRPLLTDGIYRGRKLESGASRAACMDPHASPEGNGGRDKTRDSRLDMLFGDNRQYLQVMQRANFRRMDVVLREPFPIVWHVGRAVVNVLS